MKSAFGLHFPSITFSTRANVYGFAGDEATCRVFLVALNNLGCDSADIVDWSDEPCFPEGENWEIMLNVDDLEAVVAGAAKGGLRA